MAEDEVDFDEHVDIGDDEVMEETTAAPPSRKQTARDAAGRRTKGRGPANSSMQDDGKFDTIDSRGGAAGPAKCKARQKRMHSIAACSSAA
eukprot:3495046-Pleurochrysis_carterae.AAC.1